MKSLLEMGPLDSVRVGVNIAIIILSCALYIGLVMCGMEVSNWLADVIVGPRKAVKVAVRDVPYEPEQPAKEAEG